MLYSWRLVCGPRAALLNAAFAAAVLVFASAFPAQRAQADDSKAAAPKETVRPEVGTPLLAAQGLIGEKKYAEAMARIDEAGKVAKPTAYEQYMIDSLRALAANGMGDEKTAVTSYEALVNSGRLPPANQLKIVQALAGTYYRMKDYPNAIVWSKRYLKDGGTEPSVHEVLTSSLYNAGDYEAASADLKQVIADDEKAGRTSSETHLQLLLNSDIKTHNDAGIDADVDKLLVAYPKKQYWDIAINRVLQKPGFSDRLDIYVLRLRFAVDAMRDDADYMNLAQLCMASGYTTEAKKTLDAGFAAGVLGKGADAGKQKKLQAEAGAGAAEDLKAQRAIGPAAEKAEKAKTGVGMVNAGWAYVLNGSFSHGLALMEGGLQKGGLHHPEEGRLLFGIACTLAGEKEKALSALQAVQGADGFGDLAHLWTLFAGEQQ